MTVPTSTPAVLARIEEGLARAATILREFQPGAVKVSYKSAHHPVTEADLRVNQALYETLVAEGEGWLSEEGPPARRDRERTWVVDPIDGTREFIKGVPEWCVSIAFVENGVAVAGGILNPATGETFLGSRDAGVRRNGVPARVSGRTSLAGSVVLASRSEMERGEWKRYEHAPFQVRAVGSIAYKLALVAAGQADATWTARPKHEWDIAGGAALVEAAGGVVRTLEGSPLRFNQRNVEVESLVACCTPGMYEEIAALHKR